ncbi:MAG TPA: 16S rRNA (adenine(1518)-N(6)/adenine(1519)-N(6))-dimethyltransferase RsmA [Chlorobium sp.]|uniref:Ribosomal RNA small subunit methyltransferase A n=1 Tax=Chlorobium phaeovibrioides (strain DSM 265 / 1930) TaxID=290318 RepID=A4SEZ1_CHLPM|nr:16S rRNA (adenine(1518)-N(6)/adenine(1519)-N(6))-dimethyltransferase RsmA [Chlorobium sp.]
MRVEYKHTEIAVKKKLGQNFLTDSNITRKIVAASGALPTERILEIGPGFGALTKEISALTPHFTAVEKDRALAAFIRREYPSLQMIEADFLDLDLEELSTDGPLRVLGNIPYSITTPIIFKLLEARHNILSATLMMQHEVALRLTAKPSTKEYGILAVQLQSFCTVRYLFKVGRKVFKPQPNVDSAVISMTPKKESPVENPLAYRQFVRTAFHQRRKTLLNNLRDSYDLSSLTPETLKLRAEALSIEEFITLFSQLRPLEALSTGEGKKP